MFKLDNDFLTSLGLGSLPVDEKNRLLQMIYERLEMNVGMRLAEKMTDAQLDEFESFIDRNDEAGALKWLETNFPNYKDVVAEELDKLKIEVQQASPQILAAAQAFPSQPGSSTAPVPPPMPPQPAPQYAQPAAPPQGYPYQPTTPNPAVQPSFSPSPQGAPTPAGFGQPVQPLYGPAPSSTPPTPGFMPQQPSPSQPQPGLPPQPPGSTPTSPTQFTPPPPGFTPGQ